MPETLFNKSADPTATLVKGDISAGIFLLTFPTILKKNLGTAASQKYVIGVTDSD